VLQIRCNQLLDWKVAADLALGILFPSIIFIKLLKSIQRHSEITIQFGFEIALKRLLHWAYQ
jgi:hypothetical protein